MANLSNIPSTFSPQKHFYNDGNLKCTTLVKNNKVTGFSVIHEGKEKIFKVNEKTLDILKAFTEMENYVAKLK